MTSRDKRIWERMGYELAILEELASGVLCDKEYQSVMSKAALSGLSRAITQINKVRAAADSRSSAHLSSGPDLFYGFALDPARKMAQDLRERVKNER